MYTKQHLDLLEYRLKTLVDNSISSDDWFEYAIKDVVTSFGIRSKQWYKLVDIFKKYLVDKNMDKYRYEVENLFKEFIEDMKADLNQQHSKAFQITPTIPAPQVASANSTIITDRKDKSILNNWEFWVLATIIVGGFFWFGYYVGTTKYDKDKINLDRENEKLKEEVQVVRDSSNLIKDSVDYWKRVYSGTKRDIYKYRRNVPNDIVDSIDNLIY